MKMLSGIAIVLTLFAQCAFATTKVEPPLRAKSKAEFEQVVTQIRAEMQPNGRFGTLDERARQSVDSGLGEMSALFDKTPEVANMTEADKRTLFNTQEEVNAALLKNDGDRLVCKKEIRSGTHFPTTICRTAREIESDRQGAQDWARKNLQLPNDYRGN